MSVQVSYKKQTLLGIIGLLILFLTIEAIANVWWVTQINCEFEENEIFMNMNEEEKRQLCVDLYEVKTLGDELIPNQQSSSVTINSLGFRGDEFSSEKPDNVYRIFMLGGSTMFGHGATSDKTTIPGYTQDFFQKYDAEFKINNDKFYCSELIHDIFLEANNNTPIFQLEPMTYKVNGKTLLVWEEYFNNLNIPIPENEPGINPGGISLSNKIRIIHDYSL